MEKKFIIIIKQCIDCPNLETYHTISGDMPYCKVKDKNINDIDYKISDWCPLEDK